MQDVCTDFVGKKSVMEDILSVLWEQKNRLPSVNVVRIERGRQMFPMCHPPDSMPGESAWCRPRNRLVGESSVLEDRASLRQTIGETDPSSRCSKELAQPAAVGGVQDATQEHQQTLPATENSQ